MKIFKFNTAV